MKKDRNQPLTVYLSSALPDNFMILVIDNNFNPLNQQNYDSFINSIKQNRNAFFDAVFPPDSHVIFYGTYPRSFVSSSDISRTTLKLQRVFDKNTGMTHILIPAQLVPYSSVPLQFQVMIISAADSDLSALSALYNLDLKTLLHIRSLFRAFWDSLHDWFSVKLTALTQTAFQLTGRQFMQMRGTLHLFPPT